MAGKNSGTWSATKAVLLSASASTIPTTRGLLVGTAGTATVVDADGNTCTDIPLQAGYNPLQIQKLTTLTSAANVWALY
jgi:hypothetical protein